MKFPRDRFVFGAIACHSLILLLLRTVDAHRLVVFAGPHKTSETSIEEFFFSFAHGPASADADSPRQQALRHWVWPQIHGHVINQLETTPHQVYGHLVTDASNSKIQTAILDGIKAEYNRAKRAGEDPENFQGVIIGSEEFDRVGGSPYSDVDAVDAVRRIVSTLDMTPQDVTIVLLYCVPRLDQWLGIFNFIPLELSPGDDNPYQQFLCNSRYARNMAWDAIDHAMNPLKVAHAYKDAGYNVQLLDLSGIQAKGYDVEHIIGCFVLNGECDPNGYLMNLRDESYLKNFEANDEMEHEERFHGLTHDQQSHLEQLFRLRDCAYQGIVYNSKVSINFQKEMLSRNCSETDYEMAEYLTDTDYMLTALQSQVGCNVEPVAIPNVLDGTAEPPDMHNFQVSWEEADDSTEKSSPVENTNDASDHDHSKNSSERPPWTMPVFLVVFLGASIFGFIWTRRADRRIRGRYSMPSDLELQSNLSRQRPNLSVLT